MHHQIFHTPVQNVFLLLVIDYLHIVYFMYDLQMIGAGELCPLMNKFQGIQND